MRHVVSEQWPASLHAAFAVTGGSGLRLTLDRSGVPDGPCHLHDAGLCRHVPSRQDLGIGAALSSRPHRCAIGHFEFFYLHDFHLHHAHAKRCVRCRHTHLALHRCYSPAGGPRSACRDGHLLAIVILALLTPIAAMMIAHRKSAPDIGTERTHIRDNSNCRNNRCHSQCWQIPHLILVAVIISIATAIEFATVTIIIIAVAGVTQAAIEHPPGHTKACRNQQSRL